MNDTVENARQVDLYLRLSVAADGADSLERQESDLRGWAAREGLSVRHVWRDAGRSGYRNVKRAGFDGALKALLSGEVRTLAVWKLDRLSRRGAGQIGMVLDDVERVGGRLVFFRDGLDTSNGNAARLPIVTLSEIARAESANTSLRVKSRKDANRRQGRYLGGLPPYGYEVDEERHFVPREPEFALMREVVRRVQEGDSLLTICRDFNARGVVTRRGGQWRPSALSAALRSPALAGLMPHKHRAADGTWISKVEAWRDPETGETVSLLAEGCEPIASEAEQTKLLTVMDGRLRQYGRGKRVVRQPRSLLGGLLVCSSCHGKAHTFGNSYRCRKWTADGNDCPAPLSVSTANVEVAVVRAWANKLSALHDEPNSPLLQAVAARWLEKNDPAPLREREELKEQLDEARARIDRADEDHYVKGTLDGERHARITSRLQDQIARLNARLADMPVPTADLGALLDPELSLPAFEASTVHEQRELLRLAIERVQVSPAPTRGARFHPQERVSIYWAGGG